MSTSYHHGNLGPALVQTAVDLARAQGPDGVVLREVARRTGVSHNAAYRHFADRGQLLAAVASVAMDLLRDAMLERIDSVAETDPQSRARARLREVGRAYVHFAMAEPGLYEVAFANAEPVIGPPDPESAGPYAVLGRTLDELVAAGALSPDRREGADVVCWAAVHGYAMLHLRGPLRGLPAELREARLSILLESVDRGLLAD